MSPPPDRARDEIGRKIDLSVRDIVVPAFDEAQTILKERRSDLDKGAEPLLTKAVLTADEFQAIRRLDDSLGSGKKVA
jgi:ATP-dependent Zn protease